MYKVYFVGAGPGAADLITVRGLEILRQADVVIYDYLVDKTILEETKQGAQFFCCDKLGKNRYSDGFLKHQDRINKLIVKKARQGKKVIRLKNGDPSIFSRLSQELDALVRGEIEFEVVPGVTAASAASSFSGIPLTDRRFASSCVFVTGHEDPGKKTSSIDWYKIAGCQTIILYMAVESLKDIVNKLIKAGKDKHTPIAMIQDASLVTQKIFTGTLRDIVNKAKDNKVRPPAIIIIGETVNLEKRFNWLKKNRRILFTGLSKKRFFIKGTYFHLPLIRIEPIPDYREFDNYLRNIRQFNWIVFTSRYSAEYFFNRLKQIGCDSRILRDIKIAAIGNSTASKLLDLGIQADLVPKNESSRGLLDVFKRIDIKNKKIFLPRSDIADKGLTQGLKGLGAEVTVSTAYKNVVPGDLPELDLNYFNEIMFTSPSGVRNFAKRYGKVPRGIKISCIGEVTRKEVSRCYLSKI